MYCLFVALWVRPAVVCARVQVGPPCVGPPPCMRNFRRRNGAGVGKPRWSIICARSFASIRNESRLQACMYQVARQLTSYWAYGGCARAHAPHYQPNSIQGATGAYTKRLSLPPVRVRKAIYDSTVAHRMMNKNHDRTLRHSCAIIRWQYASSIAIRHNFALIYLIIQFIYFRIGVCAAARSYQRHSGRSAEDVPGRWRLLPWPGTSGSHAQHQIRY